MLDPGGTCGLLYGAGSDPSTLEVATAKCALVALPQRLYADMAKLKRREVFSAETALVYETFNLVPGKARQQGGSSMPSSEGIGMLKGVACAFGWGTVGVPPGCKTAGHQYAAKHLPTIAAAYAAAKNDHERDVCDLAGYYLRQRALGKVPSA